MSALVWGGVGWGGVGEPERGGRQKPALGVGGENPCSTSTKCGDQEGSRGSSGLQIQASALAGSSAVVRAQQPWLGKLVFTAKNESSPPSASMRPTVRRALDLEGGSCLHEHGGPCL